jgi:hypothetical protein
MKSMSTPYIFSSTELQHLLHDAIQLYCRRSGADEIAADRDAIIRECMEAFDGMREIFHLDGAIELSDAPAELHFADVLNDAEHLPAHSAALCNRCLQIAINAALTAGPALRSLLSAERCERCHAPNRNRPAASTDPLPPPYDQPPPSDGPGQEHDTPDGGPRARGCHTAGCERLATHLVTTPAGNVLHLCIRHAVLHRRAVPYVCACGADRLGGQPCTCESDARAELCEVAA